MAYLCPILEMDIRLQDESALTKSRPRSSGLMVSTFFFLAFMMLGWASVSRSRCTAVSRQPIHIEVHYRAGCEVVGLTRDAYLGSIGCQLVAALDDCRRRLHCGVASLPFNLSRQLGPSLDSTARGCNKPNDRTSSTRSLGLETHSHTIVA